MKSVKFSRIKNFVIVGLVFAAIYQTGMLWLGDYSGHNFFYSFLNIQDGDRSGKNISAEVIDAQKIVVGYGNKSFNVIYPGVMDGDNILAKTNAFISGVLSNGQYVKTEDTALDDYISQKCVIYDFAFNVSATQYFIGIGAHAGEDLDKITEINQIIAVPSASKNGTSYLYIVDAETGKTNIYEADTFDEAEQLYTEIKDFEELNIDKIKYISTQQSGFNIFGQNTFVPQWTKSKYEYENINKVSPFKDAGEDAETAIESGTSAFFENYSAKNLTKDTNGVYMISDNSTVVKYYPQGIIEYYNYDDGMDGKTNQTLSTAYYACKQFLKRDELLNTRLFLSDVQIKSDGLVFCFDYCVNDIPVFLSESVKESLSIEHSAEVVVENNTVKKYKRYAYDFVLSNEKDKEVNVDFLGAMNKAIASTGHEDTVNEIKDIVLGYYVDENEQGYLKWFTYVDGGIYTIDTVDNTPNQDAAEDEK
ncbi:MAG TPA: hypothetical protein DIC60_02500 [Lachnospiraceae bacterium]|nr:hypothetical protein [Lachnospiraceae bacterium]